MNKGEAIRQAYLLAWMEQTQCERRLSEIGMEQRRLEQRLETAKEIRVSLKDGACRECLGNGWVRIQHAQDDIKTEKCELCHGTGLPGEGR